MCKVAQPADLQPRKDNHLAKVRMPEQRPQCWPLPVHSVCAAPTEGLTSHLPRQPHFQVGKCDTPKSP